MPNTVAGLAGLPCSQTFNKMMGDRKYLASVVLSFLSHKMAYVFHFSSWSRTLALSRRATSDILEP
jgi:hypothetical protein